MLYNFKKVNISNLIIESQFDYQSREKKVKLSEEGSDFSVSELNEIRELSEVDHIKNLFEVNAKLCNVLNLNFQDQVRWDYLIGKEKCKSYTDEFLREINFTRQTLTTYHTEVLPQRKMLYEDLSKVLDSEGVELETPIYNHSGVSGRTSITSGFNFLTSSKDFRKSCRSSIKDNNLISIDFKSCEPNLYLRAIGKNIKNPDVYDYLMSELNIRVESRESLKRGILAVLYGASDDTAGRILGGDKKILDKIKSFFEIEEKTEQLQKEFDNAGLREKIQFVSISVKPSSDSPKTLRAYAERLGADLRNWTFLTGREEDIYPLAEKGFFLTAFPSDSAQGGIFHTDQVTLLDSEMKIRGYYEGTSTKAMDSLFIDAKDLITSLNHP